MILYEMLTGKLPFVASNNAAMFRLVAAGDFKMPTGIDAAAQASLSHVAFLPNSDADAVLAMFPLTHCTAAS